MITLEKLRIYQRYGGDIDGIARVGSAREKQIISDSDWRDIDMVLQDFAFKKKGIIGESYRVEMEQRLKDLIPDPSVAAELERMA